MFKLDSEKAEVPEIRLPTRWIIERTREFQKTIYFCFIDYAKAFDWITTNWKILKKMGLLDYLPCLLRNLYAGQEAKVRTKHGITDWFKIGKEVHQACILSPCLFNLYAEHIIRETLCWRNHKLESRLPGEISTTSDMQMITTLMVESEEELKRNS